MHLTKDQIDQASKSAVDALRNNQTRITSGALSTTKTLTEIITGAFVVLFTLIFFLYGGRNIYHFVTQVFPISVRERVRTAGKAGFSALIGYVRATFLVALVDAIGIGTGLAIMSVPLALPLASLVFLGAFVPLVGAVISGSFAVIVALFTKGWVYALITLGVVIGVQQLEAHVLQPLVMGRAVSIHPLAVILGITTGGVLSGIVGALLAVPTIAFVDRAARVLLEPSQDVGEQPDDEEPTAITAEPDRLEPE
jgi:predicted PurR-regulated permease PerM